MKKIIIIVITLAVIVAIVFYFMPWGGVESEVVKTEIENNDSLNEQDNKVIVRNLSVIEPGVYRGSVKSKDNVELLFNLEGLKKTTGRFNDFEVSFSIDSIRENSELNVDIKSESIFTNNNMRDDHIKEPDFFDVANFPIINYNSELVELGDTSLIAKGELTLLGQTNKLDLPFKYVGEGVNTNSQKIHAFEGVFEFDRTQFGMKEEAGVGNIVKITFYVELK